MTYSSLVAVAACFGVALRFPISQGLTIGLLVALVLLPVWWGVIAAYRGARWWLGVGALAVVSGVLLTLFDSDRTFDPGLLASESLTMLAMLGIVGVVLWARTVIGTPAAAVVFGLGELLNALATGLGSPNLWKYEISVPVSVIALGLAAMSGRRLVEVLVLIVLAVISVFNDSRSITAFFMIAAAVSLWQGRPRVSSLRPKVLPVLLALAALAYATYSTVQALILDGVFGEATRQRTEAQLDASGSLIAGGRPELGAAFALVSGRPWGYGSGVTPTSNDVWLAKTGMSGLNYDPNNGYVENYMFGGQYEVHSVLGDLWIRFGIVGAVFAVLTVLLCLVRTASAVSIAKAPALVVFLTVLAVWDTLFSPYLTSYRGLALVVALVLVHSPGKAEAGPGKANAAVPLSRPAASRS